MDELRPETLATLALIRAPHHWSPDGKDTLGPSVVHQAWQWTRVPDVLRREDLDTFSAHRF